MDSFEWYILSTEGADRARWIEALDKAPVGRADLHYHPDYMHIYEQTYGDTSQAILCKIGSAVFLHPFVIRQIPNTSPVQCDITSVYGYGGAVLLSDDSAVTPDVLTRFEQERQSWMESQKFVSEYCLLHPILLEDQKTIAADPEIIKYRKHVVAAELDIPLADLWSRIEERQRKAIGVARRKGVEVFHPPLSEASVADFQTRYLQTMNTVGASEFWKFPDDYFWNCVACLGSKHVTMLDAKFEGKTIATLFLLQKYDTVYYHFACSDPEHRKLNASTLLLFDAMVWAKGQGYKWFHMGGGRTTQEDSLYTFKNSFAAHSLPLYGYRKIIDTEAYAALEKSHAEKWFQGHDDPPPADFFPIYRS